MLILEIAVAITILAIFPREDTFLERQLVVGLYRLDHLLDLGSIGADVLNGSRARLARDAGEILDAGPTLTNGIGDHIVPQLGGTDTEQDLAVRLANLLHSLNQGMNDDAIIIINE